MINIEDRLYTVEEYFALVEESKLKIEFHRGQLFAQVGGAFSHNLISVNTINALYNSLSDKDCIVLNSD